MSDYKIGILTIGYNRANNLLRLLNSINAATFPTDDVDLLISIDNSGTRLRKEIKWHQISLALFLVIQDG